MTEIGRGTRVFESSPVRGRWRMLHTPDDVLELMDTSAEGSDAGGLADRQSGGAGARGGDQKIIACVADAGATFLAPVFEDLAAVVCLSGTPMSHIGIVSREYHVPCVMGTALTETPEDGREVEVDCSDGDGVIRLA